MAVLSQGTNVYFLDPTDDSIVTVDCATSFSPGGNPAEQIETTCLEETSRSYLPGLRTPGQASLEINADPENDSHVRMHELAETDPPPVLRWAVGWSDGTDEPTFDAEEGDFDLPETRTWFVFEGYISDFPFDFTQNAVVTSSVSIQRSGGSQWIKKVTP